MYFLKKSRSFAGFLEKSVKKHKYL